MTYRTLEHHAMPVGADVLLPTCNRRESLLMTLSGLAAQTLRRIRVIVADQSDEPAERSPVILAHDGMARASGTWKGESHVHSWH